ncbi:two tm domain protein [Entamoeba histolytica]|uniref:Two tm domain protein n=3 Tax=Entamoeba TaxID=5758 RepID=A0A175JDQ3_ENTHI|nr:hypothetical protein ENU1_163440 [Entamoeba nuttalli P19]EKE38527.1 hypothetical protein ENU1_163440 [Entamoeba nuttalli P19]GAT91583.1 two tm domain protein [Entamoeba histolytica]|eukprot:XP_008859133.1 hypothetical protein ENU1_163440 [Entamoeba nuttalli P19]
MADICLVILALCFPSISLCCKYGECNQTVCICVILECFLCFWGGVIFALIKQLED